MGETSTVSKTMDYELEGEKQNQGRLKRSRATIVEFV